MSKIFKILLAAISLVILLIVFFIYHATNQLDNYPAKDILTGSFDLKITSVKNLRGSGMTFMGHDVYIRFEKEERATPKDFKQVKSINPKEPRSFFLKVFPEDHKLLSSDKLSCKFDPGRKKAPNSNGTWLCFSPENGTHWFRNWWIS